MDAVNRPHDVVRSVQSERHDAIMLGLVWWTMREMPHDGKTVLGWSTDGQRVSAFTSTTASIVSSVFGFALTFIDGAVFRYVRQCRNDFS